MNLLVQDTGFKAASISSQYLVPHWMERLLEDCEDEENVGMWSIQTLDGKARYALWSACELLGARRAGVAAQACRLLERYLTRKVRASIDALELRSESLGAWDAYKCNLGARLPLLMASCAKLAGKMNSSGIQLSAKKIRAMLLSKGIAYTLSDVIDAEFEVFRTLNFRVPLWTSVEAAELLAQEVSLPRSAFRLIPAVVEYAEYRRDVIESRARWAADLPLSGTATLRSLHLAAAAVAAVEHIAGLFAPTCAVPDSLPRLALLVRATPLLLHCIYDLIVEQVLQDEGDSGSSFSIDAPEFSD